MERIGSEKTKIKSPHCNKSLNIRWGAMRKARTWAKISNLDVDWEFFEEKRSAFERENRRMRRIFTTRTEALLERYPNSRVAEVINKDRRKREELDGLQSKSGELLNPEDFTEFIGNFQDQNQVEIPLTEFSVPDRMKEDSELERSMGRERRNKAPGRDGVHSEMLKIEPSLMAELLYEGYHR